MGMPGMPGGPRGGIIIGAGMPPPMRAAEGPPTPRTGPDRQGQEGEGEEVGVKKGGVREKKWRGTGAGVG